MRGKIADCLLDISTLVFADVVLSVNLQIKGGDSAHGNLRYRNSCVNRLHFDEG